MTRVEHIGWDCRRKFSLGNDRTQRIFIHSLIYVCLFTGTKKKDFAVELRGEDGCNSSIWSTLVPTDDDEDAIACRMTNSAQVVLHDRLITETTSFKKCTASAPPQTLPSLIFCPSTTHRRPDQQQQQHNVYSITIDSRGQVEIIQDTTAKSSSKNCIIIPSNLMFLKERKIKTLFC